MENPKDQLIERIKSANNVLVTVSSNPSVDQLAAAIGLTLTLNKMGKHATAVYSGSTPSTIEFLKPEKTIEKNTDSLRDFIIALDKSKADKLRYKVEQDHVKIFITPYRTSISEKDLEFSQGDFNVDVIVALGVTEQKDLDQAITAHGRILHDATTISVTTGAQSNLGSINWADSNASSLCEMIVGITDVLQADVLDSQIATAFMTGIVAETDRFSNDKTSSSAMSASAKLMSAGANQQLVASELQEKPAEAEVPQDAELPVDDPVSDTSSFQIDHEVGSSEQSTEPVTEELVEEEPEEQPYEPFTYELPAVQEEAPVEPAEPTQEEARAEVEAEAPSEHEVELPEPEETEQPVEAAIPETPLEIPTEVAEIPSDETVEPLTDLPEEVSVEPLPEMPEVSEVKPAEPEQFQDETPPINPVIPEVDAAAAGSMQGNSSFVFDPPERGGKLTANAEPEGLDPVVDPLAGSTNDAPILSHDAYSTDETMGDADAREDIPSPSMTLPSEAGAAAMPTATEVPNPFAIPPAFGNAPMPPVPEQPLQNNPAPFEPMLPPQIPAIPDQAPEPAAPSNPSTDLDSARDAVAAAVAGGNQPLPPIEALNAAPLDLEIKQTGETGILDHGAPNEAADSAFIMPENLVPPVDQLPVDPTATDLNDPVAPPPVPPPLMPPTFGGAPIPPVPEQPNGEQPPESANNNPQNPFNLPPA